jgi:hypothetical protein
MSDIASILWIITILWIGWPLNQIASDLRTLRKLAERNK